MLTKEQLIERKKGIGGSDAAAICGVSKYKTPLEVYLNKTSDKDPEEAYSPIFERGHLLEPVIRRAFEMRTEMTVDFDLPPFVHREHKFMRVNVDGIIMGIGEPEGDNFWTRPIAVFEAKTSYIWTKGFHLGNIPDDYFVQVQHAMACTNLPVAYIAYLLKDKDYFDLACRMVKMLPLEVVAALIQDDIEFEEVPRDDEFIERMIGIQKEFWEDNVEKRTAPDPSNVQDMSLLFPKEIRDKKIVASEEIINCSKRRVGFSKSIKALQKEIDTMDKEMMEYMGDAAFLINEKGDICASWKVQSRKSLDSLSLKKSLPDVYSRFAREKESRVFKVSDIEIDLFDEF